MSAKELVHKLWLTVLFMSAYALFYQYPNFYPLDVPVQLHMTWVDRVMPFLPWTFLVYLSDWALIVGVGFALRGDAFYVFVRMAFASLILCGLCFIFFPTVYPRPEYPLVANYFVRLAMDVVSAADQPTNCFPSMHVSMTSAAAWCARSLGRKVSIGIWIWALAVFISTLTTKQHYVVDIFGGFIVLALSVAVNHVYLLKRDAIRSVVGRATH